MVTMMHPVGSKPPAVYWRRRAVLLITVVLLVISLYVLLGRGSGRPGASALAPTSTPSTSAADHPTSTTAARTPSPSTTGSNGCPARHAEAGGDHGRAPASSWAASRCLRCK